MDDYLSNEPLNLVKKKTKPKPVAVVAPSSVSEDKHPCIDSLSLSSAQINDEDVRNVKPASDQSRPEETPATKNGFASFLGAPYDTNFLTNLYVNSLMTAGYLNNNYPYGYSYQNGFGSGATSPQLNGNNFTSLWAQQRFWQMVNWHEAQRKAEMAAKAADDSGVESSSGGAGHGVGIGEPLKVAIPSCSNNSDRSETKESPKKVPKKKKHLMNR